MAKARCTGWPKPVRSAYANDSAERDGGERQPAHAQPAADGEDKCGEDAEVQTGDDQQMKGAGTLERRAQIAAEPGAVACDHGGEHGSVVVAESEERGQGMRRGTIGELYEAVACAGLECVQQAGEAVLRAVAGHDQLFRFCRADDADALAEHPRGAVPYAGIAVALRRPDRRCYGNDIAATEQRHGGIGRRVERKTQTAARRLAVCPRGRRRKGHAGRWTASAR